MSNRPPDPHPTPPPPVGGGQGGGGPPTMADVMALPDPLRQLVLWLLRHGEAGLEEATAECGLDAADVRVQLETLVGRGFLYTTGADGAVRYKTRLAPRRASAASIDIWDRLK